MNGFNFTIEYSLKFGRVSTWIRKKFISRNRNHLIHKRGMNETKEKLGLKAIPKLKEEKNASKSVNPSVRKSIAHSGIYFPVRLKKPTDVATESPNEQVDTSSIFTKKNEPRRAKKEEETLLTSLENLEISTEPAVELFETKTHVDETVESKSVTSHQCQGTCKCSDSIKLLHAVCSPHSSTKSELPDVGKDENESRIIFHSKSVRTRNTASDVGKKEKTVSTRHPVCSELKPQNRRVSKIRPPSDYKCKLASAISDAKRVLFMPQSTTASTPQPTSAPVTQPECVSNTVPSSELTRGSVSSSSSEPTLEGSDADELVSPLEPPSVRASLTSSATASDLTNMVEIQSSDRPAFWPPSAPTYEIIHSLEPLTVTISNPLIPLRCKSLSEQKSEPSRATETVPLCLGKPQTSKIAKVPQKCASSSRSSRIPKIHPNLATDTNKVSQKNPSSSKPQRNLKQTLVKTSISDKRASTAKTICDSNEQMKTKSTERKQVSPKKSCK